MLNRYFKALKNIAKNLKNIEYHTNLAKSMNANILSSTMLENLLDENFRKYIPFTDYALNPYTITHILNDLMIHSRKNIVEFGAGTSTIYISLFMQKHNNGQSFVSFDQDSEWLETLRTSYINDISLAKNQNFKLVHAPLLPTNYGKVDQAKWYSEEVVNKSVDGPIDCVIVDGPTGDINRFARFPVVNFINQHLSDDGIVFIDDATREGESEIIKVLVEKHGFKKMSTLFHCILTKNSSYFTRPIGTYVA